MELAAHRHCESWYVSIARFCLSHTMKSPFSNAARAFVLDILPRDDFSRSSFGNGIKYFEALFVIILTTSETAVAVSHPLWASSGPEGKLGWHTTQISSKAAA